MPFRPYYTRVWEAFELGTDTGVMTLSSSGCIFCGATPLTREHVLAQWMGKMPMADPPLPLNLEVTHDVESNIHKWTTKNPAALVARCVCGPCNNGWMSDIQTAPQAALTSMIEGRATLLDSPTRRAVATWAALTAMTSRYAASPIEPVEEGWLRHMYAERVPPSGWYIWLSGYRGQTPFRYDSRQIALSFKDAPPTEVTATPNGVLLTVVVGYLVVKVLGIKEGYAADQPGLLRIWPERTGAFSIEWPPERNLSDASLESLCLLYAGAR